MVATLESPILYIPNKQTNTTTHAYKHTDAYKHIQMDRHIDTHTNKHIQTDTDIYRRDQTSTDAQTYIYILYTLCLSIDTLYIEYTHAYIHVHIRIDLYPEVFQHRVKLMWLKVQGLPIVTAIRYLNR